jgi:hypothetical protein
MFWQTKLIEDGLIPLPEKPEDYDQHPGRYLLKISRQGHQYFQKVFTPDPEGHPLIKEVAKPEPIQEQLVIEEKLNPIDPKPTPKNVDSDQLKVMFRDLKSDVQKQIDETVSEIKERLEKIEKKAKFEPSRKLSRFVLSLIALVSFLSPFKSLQEPKLEPLKVKTIKPVPKPRVYYYSAPKNEFFTPIYKLIKLFQDLIKPK